LIKPTCYHKTKKYKNKQKIEKHVIAAVFAMVVIDINIDAAQDQPIVLNIEKTWTNYL